ncbi:TrmB family transcriptional regulator [Nanoarchaeota archaeon]
MEYENIRLILEKYGLSHNEAKIYLTLLRLGQEMAGKIAKEAMIDRTSCYDALRKLLKKGLVSYALESNRKMFKAISPQRLVEILKEKQEEIEIIIPELNALHKKEKDKHNVTMYKGFKGIKAVFEDILKEAKGQENLVIDSSGKFREKMAYYLPYFLKGLDKNNIKIKRLVRKDSPPQTPNKNMEIRFFARNIKESVVSTNIYGNKVSVILWTDIPEAIIIENKSAADAYRDYFDILWKTSTK